VAEIVLYFEAMNAMNYNKTYSRKSCKIKKL